MTLKELISTMPGYVDATNPTDQAVLDWGNTKTLPGRVRYKDVRSYLHVVAKFPAILVSVDPAAKAMVDVLDHFNDVDLTDSIIFAAVNMQLDALITANLIDATDKTTILAMGDNKLSPFENAGFSRVLLGEINSARNSS